MKRDALKEGLGRFFDQFTPTRELVDQFIRSNSHAQELLVLLCARIDALASGSASEDEHSGDSFTGFVTTHSGRQHLFENISVGDLYYELDYHLWLLPGMIEKAGRIHIFSRINDPIKRLLVDSEIPLTLEESRRLLKRLERALRRHFRVAPGQRRRKHSVASAEAIDRAIRAEFNKQSEDRRRALTKAITPLLKMNTVARILYRRFRCEAIHGGRVRIDEAKFFAEREPYWRPMYSDHYGPFQLIEFPAQFLATLFADCVANYRKKLEATRRVPPAIHFEMFPEDVFGHLELLDEALLPRTRIAVPS
jgi:hypothetical protein